MPLLSDPLTVLALLLAAVTAAAWLGRAPGLRQVGGAFIVIVLGALLANLAIIPKPDDLPALYDPIFAVVTPIAIFLVLLEANLRALRKVGAPMLIAFALGASGVMLGVLAATQLTPVRDLVGGSFAGLAGMFTGTYIGGSSNFNAIALEYGIAREGNIFTAAVVVDNLMTNVWIIVTLLLPPILARSRRYPRKIVASEPSAETGAKPIEGVNAIALPLAMAVAAHLLSKWLSALTGGAVPAILILTTLALAVAQLPFIARLSLGRTLGMSGLYLFLAAVGASADLQALAQSGLLGASLFAFVGIIFIVHAIVLLGAGALLRLDPDVLAIASTANIGGSTTAIALAEVRKRDDLVLPGLLAGSIGTATGTYAGFAIAGLF